MNEEKYELLYKNVPERRMVHTIGVERTALLIASRHYPGLDEDVLRTAAILHDVTKYYTREEHLALCKKYGIVFNEAELSSGRILHQITGAIRASELGASPLACDAIRWHTTGKADMNAYEKTIMLADYIEPSRDYDGIDTIRECYDRLEGMNDPFPVERTLIIALNFTICEVLDRGEVIHPDSINARNYLISKYTTPKRSTK